MTQPTWGFQTVAGGINLYDLSDPTDISQMYFWPLDYVDGDSPIIAKDGYLFIAGGNGGGAFYILDIRAYTAIALVGTKTDALLEDAFRMAIIGDYAYIATVSGGTDYVVKIDISNKSNPYRKAYYGVTIVTGLDGYGDYLYAMRSIPDPDCGLYVYDGDMVVQDTLLGAGAPNYVEANYCCHREGEYLYTAGYADQRLSIINVADPTFVYLVGTLDTGAAFMYDILKDGDYCYIVYLPDGVYVVDVTNPLAPVMFGYVGGLSNPVYMKKSGDYLFVTGDNFYSIDVADPSTPAVSDTIVGTGYGHLAIWTFEEPVIYSVKEIGTGVTTGGEIEGLLTLLNDDRIVGTLDVTGTVGVIIDALLDYSSHHIAGTILLGGVDTALDLTLTMSFQNKTLLKCLQDIVKVVGGYLEIRHDPNDPHIRYLYLLELEADIGQELRIGKNLKTIESDADFGELCTKFYPLGDGEGVDQLNLTMLEVVDEVADHLPPDATYGYLKLGAACRCYKDWTAVGDALPSHMTVTLTGTGDVTALWKQGSDARFLRADIGDYDAAGEYKISYTHAAYLLHDNVDAYGVVSKDFAIKSITTALDLYYAGLTELNKRANPKVSYKVGAADLSEIAGREFEFLPIGSLAHVIDEGMNINTQVSVQGVKRGSLKKQGDIQYTFSNFPINLADKLIQQQEAVEALNNQGVTGVSQVVNFTTTILISDSEYPKTYRFTLNASYIRCNKVRLTWDEDASGFGAGSENLDLDVTVDGNAIGHGIDMADQDITLALTTPIIGTQHTIEWDYRGAPAAKTLLHIQVACQVFRRSIPL